MVLLTISLLVLCSCGTLYSDGKIFWTRSFDPLCGTSVYLLYNLSSFTHPGDSFLNILYLRLKLQFYYMEQQISCIDWKDNIQMCAASTRGSIGAFCILFYSVQGVTVCSEPSLLVAANGQNVVFCNFVPVQVMWSPVTKNK